MVYNNHVRTCWNPNTEKRVENTTCSGVFFDEIRVFWIASETLFIIFCPSKQKLRSKRRSKIVKFDAKQGRVNRVQTSFTVVIFSLLT